MPGRGECPAEAGCVASSLSHPGPCRMYTSGLGARASLLRLIQCRYVPKVRFHGLVKTIENW